MHLTEFLNKSITSKQLIGFLTGKLNIDVEHFVTDLDEFEIQMDPSIFDKIEYNSKEFDELLDGYGWRIGALSDWNLVLRMSKGQFAKSNNFSKKFHGLYLRGAHRGIEVFSRIGFRPAKYNALEGKDYETKCGPIYSEGRVYLWSLEAIAANAQTEFEFWNNLEVAIENASAYGKNIYLITLPDTIKVYRDPEYHDEGDGACFATQKIPSDCIELVTSGAKYKDTIAKLKTMV